MKTGPTVKDMAVILFFLLGLIVVMVTVLRIGDRFTNIEKRINKLETYLRTKQ